MSRFLSSILIVAKANLWEACAVAGLGATAAGLWQVWPPLAFIIGGVALLALGLWGARAAAWGEKMRKVQER